jgi:hypothetical protein
LIRVQNRPTITLEGGVIVAWYEQDSAENIITHPVYDLKNNVVYLF